ncbi:hypothetical protein R1flu_013330 [Riccia fluitans]|uniref:Uncharacterized protein n=1 Tax=Riccia fluitans TaxID=41844 RepID=A0ABD1YGJ4_9MARC
MNCDMSKFATVSTRLVESEVKREAEWMEWSPMDLKWDRFYSSYFFLYKPKPGGGADEENGPPIDRLIESLGKALVHFYPLAGRLVKQKNDESSRLYCNNAGAVFTHKRYAGILSEVIDEDQFQYNENISGLSDFHPDAPVYDPPLPTLVIQVIDFQCGTRCLSTSWSHIVADGGSGVHFLSSWAELCRGEPISLMPVLDRSLLSPRKSSPVLDGTAPVRFLNNYIKDPPPMKIAAPEGGASFKTLKLSKRKMDDLKAEALSGIHGGFVSTADCVSAHLWKLITQARQHQSHELTRFTTLVNGRSRLKDFPAGYFGNCLITTAICMTVRELLSKPLSHAASLIREAVKAVDEEVVKGWVDWYSVNKPHPSRLGDEPFMPGDPTFNLHGVSASWQNQFQFFQLDFGSGRPSAALRNGFRQGNFPMGLFFVLPTSTTSTNGDLAVKLFAENKVLAKLVGDELY